MQKNNKKDLIVIVTMNKYPNGDAGAVRQHAMAKAFMEKGYDVFIIGYGENTNKIEIFENVNYISMKTMSNNIIKRLISRVTFANKVVRYINKNLNNVSAILVIDGLPNLFFKTKKFAQKNKVKILHDSVEWYSPEEFKRGKLSIEYNLKNFTNKILIKRNWKVIAISKFLEKYYLKKGLETIRIPVIMDILSIPKTNKQQNEKSIFVYAGTPGKKDYLDIIIEGFCMLPDLYKNKFEFHILGVNREQLINKCGVKECYIDKLGENLLIHGRVLREEAIEWIKKANYTVLLRNSRLCYAKAGFPTKVVESLAYSTPIICNLSSDLSDYLIDGENSIIVKDCSAQEFCIAIIKGLCQEAKQQKCMQENARETGEKNFDYRLYGSILCDLLK